MFPFNFANWDSPTWHDLPCKHKPEEQIKQMFPSAEETLAAKIPPQQFYCIAVVESVVWLEGEQ